MPKYKATAYIRLSYTDDHSSESDSVSNQRKLIENFVEHNPDIEVVSEKIDDGYSGIIFDRPAFKEMMQDVTDGNIKADGKLKYQPGAIMTNLLLADEINRTSSKTQSALLEAMEELQVHGGRRDPAAAQALRRSCNGEPGGVRGHPDAARLSAGSFPDPTEYGLSQSGKHGGAAEGSPSCGSPFRLPDGDDAG